MDLAQSQSEAGDPTRPPPLWYRTPADCGTVGHSHRGRTAPQRAAGGHNFLRGGAARLNLRQLLPQAAATPACQGAQPPQNQARDGDDKGCVPRRGSLSTFEGGHSFCHGGCQGGVAGTPSPLSILQTTYFIFRLGKTAPPPRTPHAKGLKLQQNETREVTHTIAY